MGLTINILETPLINQFDDIRYSHEDFLQFCIETQGSLTQNLLLAGLTPVQKTNFDATLATYQETLSLEGSSLSNKKSSTAAISLAWDTVVAEARRKEALVRSVFDKNSPEYLRFYPGGLSPYNNTRRGDQLRLIDNLITQFTTYSIPFPGVAASITTLKAAYLSASTEQANEKGSVKGSKTKRDMDRLALANSMHEIWLTIALKNMGKPEIIRVFFNTATFDKGTNYDNDGLGRLKLQVLAVDHSPIINATISITNEAGVFQEKGLTNDDGFYESGDLKIGFYTASAQQSGYFERISRFQVFDNRDPLHEMFLES